MATYYIDPSANIDGDGLSADTPFKTWASVTWVSGNTYLQKSNTTYNGKLTIPSGGSSEDTRILISTYGAPGKAKINASGLDRGIVIAVNAHFITIDGYEVYGANTKTASVRGIVVGSNTSNRANNITIKNCIIHTIGSTVVLNEDENGIQVFGDNFKLLNTTIYDIADDGIWVQGNNFEAGYVHIYNIAKSNRIAGDCIQLDNASGTSSNYWIHDCTLDHSNVEMKQCFIDSSGINGSTGGIFEDNTCKMGFDNVQVDTSKVINIGNPNAVVRRNIIDGGWAGIWVIGNNTTCTANKVTKFKRTGTYVNASSDGIQVLNNSYYSDRADKISDSRAIEISSTCVSANIRNNAASGSGISYVVICSKTSATSNGITIENNRGLGTTAFHSVNGGVPVSNVSIDPLWDTVTLIPQSNSSLLSNGSKYWTGARPNDVNGEPLPDTFIDIGAVQSTSNAGHPKNLINSANPSATLAELLSYTPQEVEVQLDKVTELDDRVGVLESTTVSTVVELTLAKSSLPSIFSGDKEATTVVASELMADNLLKLEIRNVSLSVGAYVGIGIGQSLAETNAISGTMWVNRFYIPPNTPATIYMGTNTAYAWNTTSGTAILNITQCR
jgi:hypothetical protein